MSMGFSRVEWADRPFRDRTGDGHPLLLAAGEFGGETVQMPAEPHPPQRLLGGHRLAGDVRHHRHVLPRREGRHRVVELEDEPHVLAAVVGQRRIVPRRQVMVAEAHGASRRHVQPAEDVEQGGLAAAGGAEQGDEFAGVEFEIDPPQGVNLGLAGAEHAGDAAGDEDRGGCSAGGGGRGGLADRPDRTAVKP